MYFIREAYEFNSLKQVREIIIVKEAKFTESKVLKFVTFYLLLTSCRQM